MTEEAWPAKPPKVDATRAELPNVPRFWNCGEGKRQRRKLKVVMSICTLKTRIGVIFAIALPCLLLTAGNASADPVLDIVIGTQTRHFGRDELLRRPDVANVSVANDVAYGKAMTYRAVPVAALLAGLDPPDNAVIESVALDGFAAQLPLALLTNTDPAKAVAWLAIEPDNPRWPMLPGKSESAGPFYIVWTGASVATIRSEQWPYQLKRLASQSSPLQRWPALDVDPALPATSPARAGLALFKTQCLPCHTPERRRLGHHGARFEPTDESDPVHDA